MSSLAQQNYGRYQGHKVYNICMYNFFYYYCYVIVGDWTEIICESCRITCLPTHLSWLDCKYSRYSWALQNLAKYAAPELYGNLFCMENYMYVFKPVPNSPQKPLQLPQGQCDLREIPGNQLKPKRYRLQPYKLGMVSLWGYDRSYAHDIT